MANEETEGGMENQLWFKDAKATKMACPELEVLGPPCIVEDRVAQFLEAMVARQGEIEGCEGTVLYVKVSEAIVKVSIEPLIEERHGPFTMAAMGEVIQALASSEENLKIPE